MDSDRDRFRAGAPPHPLPANDSRARCLWVRLGLISSGAAVSCSLLWACFAPPAQITYGVLLALEFGPQQDAQGDRSLTLLDPHELDWSEYLFVKRHVENLDFDRVIEQLDLRSRVTREQLRNSVSVDVKDDVSTIRVQKSTRFSASEVAQHLAISAVGAHTEETFSHDLERRGFYWSKKTIQACGSERDEGTAGTGAWIQRCTVACDHLANLFIDYVIARRLRGSKLKGLETEDLNDEARADVLLSHTVLSEMRQGGLDPRELQDPLRIPFARISSPYFLYSLIDDFGLYLEESTYMERKDIIDDMSANIELEELSEKDEESRQFLLSFSYRTEDEARRVVTEMANEMVARHTNDKRVAIDDAREILSSIEERALNEIWVKQIPRFEVAMGGITSPSESKDPLVELILDTCDPWVPHNVQLLRQDIEIWAASRPTLRIIRDAQPIEPNES